MCDHYKKNCDIIANCCEKRYPCIKCHDQNENHELKKNLLTKIVCRKCNLKQNVSNKCNNNQCKQMFGSYYCPECKLHDGVGLKFHCNKCNMCLSGYRQDDLFHCDNCGYCIPKIIKNNHKCVSDLVNEKCAICLDRIISNKNVILKCNHVIHTSCLNGLLENGGNNILCPLCKTKLSIGMIYC